MSRNTKLKVKYLGFVEQRIVEAGETFGGQLSEGVPSTKVWDVDTAHLADVSDWSAASVDLLLAQPDFIDVTDEEVYPLSLAEVLWRGRKGDTSHLPDSLPADVTDPALANAGRGSVTNAAGYVPPSDEDDDTPDDE